MSDIASHMGLILIRPLCSVHQKNDSYIIWDHVKQLWEEDISHHLYKSKLTYDHIYLTGMSKMKVKLAAQVNKSAEILM